MAELPDIQFPPSLEELQSKPPVLADTATANTLVDAGFDPAAVVPYAPLTEPHPDELSPTPKPPTPIVTGDHVTPVDGTFEFSPAFDEIDNLVDVWYLMHPDIKLYDWQYQELLRMSGYIEGRLDGPRIHFDPRQAFRGSYCCCNGSGKDLALIATAAIGLPLLYLNVIVVITSSSYEQLKYQTENHIKRGLANLEANLGNTKIYNSVEFYHRCEKRGGEIKLFVTDEGGRAEGWHPLHPSGRLVLIINEAKSINEAVFDALDRCDGYSHWIEISSPGARTGLFYDNFQSAVAYPEKPQRGQFFSRRVDYHECPHKSEETRLQTLRKHGEHSYIYQTSYLANFWELEEDVVISAALFETNAHIEAVRDESDIGIGVDSAAGRDEQTCYVRAGAALIASKCFVQKDTDVVAAIPHEFLLPWRFREYQFNADDGGVGHGTNDQLVKRGWRVIRRLNQSAAYQKTLYLNLGAEMYFHVRKLLELGLILPPNDKKLRTQLSTRRYNETEGQGKKSLQSKRELKGRSPDRADGYVLCYFSYRPKELTAEAPLIAPPKKLMTVDEFLMAYANDPEMVNRLLAQHSQENKVKGDFTFQTVKI